MEGLTRLWHSLKPHDDKEEDAGSAKWSPFVAERAYNNQIAKSGAEVLAAEERKKAIEEPKGEYLTEEEMQVHGVPAYDRFGNRVVVSREEVLKHVPAKLKDDVEQRMDEDLNLMKDVTLEELEDDVYEIGQNLRVLSWACFGAACVISYLGVLPRRFAGLPFAFGLCIGGVIDVNRAVGRCGELRAKTDLFQKLKAQKDYLASMKRKQAQEVNE